MAGVIAQLQGDYPTAKRATRIAVRRIGDLAGVATTDGTRILTEFDGDYLAALEINDRARAAAANWRSPRDLDRRDERRYYRTSTVTFETPEHLEEALRCRASWANGRWSPT